MNGQERRLAAGVTAKWISGWQNIYSVHLTAFAAAAAAALVVGRSLALPAFDTCMYVVRLLAQWSHTAEVATCAITFPSLPFYSVFYQCLFFPIYSANQKNEPGLFS